MSGPRVLDTRHALPAFVVGFELALNAAKDLAARVPPELSPLLMIHTHQWGGYLCAQATLFGITVRLAPNPDRPQGLFPLEALRQGLLSLGEFGHEEASPALHPEVGWLRDLSPTFGQDYAEADRKLLERTLQEAVPGLPALEWAAEAFVRFVPVTPKALLGWRVFTVSTGSPRALTDWNFEEATVSDERPLTGAWLHALRTLGEREGLGPVRTFLLWENSD